jgi:lipoate-protein ligase A
VSLLPLLFVLAIMLRLIHDRPAAGAWNMAVDEVMLEQVATAPEPVLRFYAWEQPTLSLGYFQGLADRDMHVPSRNCPVVRRSTGGGAILHDREITYSVALPLADRWSTQPGQLYDVFHGSLVAALKDMGIPATLCEATLRSPLGEPFLCFQRRAKGDVLVAGHKIAGSAQRRRQGAMLQHGSVLLVGSPAAPELPGLLDLFPQVAADGAELQKALLDRWLRHLRVVWPAAEETHESSWQPSESQEAETVARDRFLSPDWTTRRELT